MESVVSVLTEGAVDLQADTWEVDLEVVDMKEV